MNFDLRCELSRMRCWATAWILSSINWHIGLKTLLGALTPELPLSPSEKRRCKIGQIMSIPLDKHPYLPRTMQNRSFKKRKQSTWIWTSEITSSHQLALKSTHQLLKNWMSQLTNLSGCLDKVHASQSTTLKLDSSVPALY